MRLIDHVKEVSQRKIELERRLENSIDTAFTSITNFMIEEDEIEIKYDKLLIEIDNKTNPDDSYEMCLEDVDNLFYDGEDKNNLFMIWYDDDLEISNLTVFTNYTMDKNLEVLVAHEIIKENDENEI